MTLISYYEKLKKDSLVNDPAQEQVVIQLQRIQDNLLTELRMRTLVPLIRKRQLINGMYLWGGVGVGKTFLLDCFYESLATRAKKRMHFFQFMRYIHQQLLIHAGKKNPLQVIARELAKDVIVLCFDEFFVKDIVDAMVLGEFLKLLFKEGICIIATSNIIPEKLYERGLQRGNFIPAIEAIKKHMTVVHLATTNDYRLRSVQAHGVFFSPHDEKAENELQHIFKLLTNHTPVSAQPITIAKRQIRIKQQAGSAIWFRFADICHIPRSQHDYLYLAEHYTFIFVSEIPVIHAQEKNVIRLFIALIDVLYDHGVKLVFSAQTNLDGIYTAGDMLFEFTRTKSRLIEMQSKSYFTAAKK